MARILSHPFRLVGSQVATVEQESAAGQAEQLSALLLTKRGERTLVPAFGVTDPVFGDVDTAELNLAVSLFGPPVQILEVQKRIVDETTQEVEVVYE